LSSHIGRADATQLRFISFCHCCLGDAKTDQQCNWTSIATVDKKVTKDSLIVVLAYNQRRFYVFSHIDPMKDAEQAKNINQDIWNEAPTAHQLLGSEGNAAREAAQATAYSKAILRTTMGDIHIKFFLEVPQTLGDFCGHARSGYYDNVIFHRIIQGFMLQTGDRLGEGTGGESIWGGEFEDESVQKYLNFVPTMSIPNHPSSTTMPTMYKSLVASKSKTKSPLVQLRTNHAAGGIGAKTFTLTVPPSGS
jgi:peptidylprolyl isomerase domain and WD repeat-containing protein 1